jgi:hypothetical protein
MIPPIGGRILAKLSQSSVFSCPHFAHVENIIVKSYGIRGRASHQRFREISATSARLREATADYNGSIGRGSEDLSGRTTSFSASLEIRNLSQRRFFAYQNDDCFPVTRGGHLSRTAGPQAGPHASSWLNASFFRRERLPRGGAVVDELDAADFGNADHRLLRPATSALN